MQLGAPAIAAVGGIIVYCKAMEPIPLLCSKTKGSVPFFERVTSGAHMFLRQRIAAFRISIPGQDEKYCKDCGDRYFFHDFYCL